MLTKLLRKPMIKTLINMLTKLFRKSKNIILINIRIPTLAIIAYIVYSGGPERFIDWMVALSQAIP